VPQPTTLPHAPYSVKNFPRNELSFYKTIIIPTLTYNTEYLGADQEQQRIGNADLKFLRSVAGCTECAQLSAVMRGMINKKICLIQLY
jgi:hypothetical protein